MQMTNTFSCYCDAQSSDRGFIEQCNHLPGVIGGEFERLQSVLAKLSAYRSTSRFSLNTSYGWKPKCGPFTGVDRGTEVEGGLLIVLPEVDSGGVDGE